jgi:hypothetical protein
MLLVSFYSLMRHAPEGQNLKVFKRTLHVIMLRQFKVFVPVIFAVFCFSRIKQRDVDE